MIDLSPLCCPSCRAPRLRLADDVTCPACGARFPIENGVPLLVGDPQEHETQLSHAREINPEWYREVQLPEDTSPWRHHLKKRRQYVTSRIRRELARRGRARAHKLLDLGCGDGNNLPWLAEFTESLYGSDYNIVRLARAHTRTTGATIFLADLLDYPANDGAFDMVFFNHVIEHIPDDEAALSTVARILAPGGLLVLGTPNEGAWWWQLAYKRAPEIRRTTDHVHFYTADTIRRKMERAGLRVFEVEHMGWGPPDWELDGRWRRHKWVDDLFERVGRIVLPKQASSLYLLATK